ncbi:MAG: alpha/beta hydrolase [Chlamydiales bacterium]|nr:alpha/beta hydrolase [Chlamydiales bacterium]
MSKAKVIFLPGNGGCKTTDNWFPYAKAEFEKHNLEVIARDFPDSHLAREKYWIPFLKDELKADENSILIGHSSGAIAAMRYAEKNRILGSVLVGTYHTDLGIDTEKISGYFDRPWQWDAIRANQKWIVVFASIDDPWIPIEEPRYLKDQLGADYHEYADQGHFGGDYLKLTFPELVTSVLGHLN